MLHALTHALRDLTEPSVQRLLWRCVLLALATFVALAAAVGLGLAALDVTGIVWLDATLTFAGSGLALVLAWLLFPATVALTLNLFAEDVAEAVERRHYAHLPPASGLSFTSSTTAALKLAGLAVLLNLLVLPLYFLPGANLIVFLALNGYLVGREYFELVAQRRLPRPIVARLRRELRGRLWLAGVIVVIFLTIPVFNLVAPVVGTAFMVHLLERWTRRSRTVSEVVAAHAERGVTVRPTGDGSV